MEFPPPGEVLRRSRVALSAFALSACAALVLCGSSSNAAELDARHVDVYRVPGRFGGWPANHGMWSWGDELLVGFSAGYFKDNGPHSHAIDRQRPEEHLLARSRDGGQTWSIEDPSKQGMLIPRGEALHGATPPHLVGKERPLPPERIDFAHPDLALAARMTNARGGESRLFYSYDRGRIWRGPFLLPDFDQGGTAPRTDYVVLDSDTCLLFLAAAEAQRGVMRSMCARSDDDGLTWQFHSWIGPELAGSGIMPSTVRLEADRLLTLVRRRHGERRWIDAFASPDLGRSWEMLDPPVADAGEGNPPCLIRLHDGRLCLTYGYRAEPYGILARFSADDGRSWSDSIQLRPAGGRDIGYCRSAQREDGRVVTIYYMHEKLLGDRFIAATIWDPTSLAD